jgi:uncharacterized membrane protein
MTALFEKLPILLVGAAAVLVVAQVLQMIAVAGQYGPNMSTILAMIFGLVVQAAQLLALAALVHYAQRIVANTAREA